MERIKDRLARNELVMAVCVNPEHGEMMIEKGCKMLSPTSDGKIINAGIQAVKRDYAKYFG